ncbi:acetyltransferase [Halobacillus halophilus]|uniref:Probable acetyltransferase EpsM n=1 Tax=Halobacillus halophilus (strain ATCC 35676 / DSM 2266 / JCM 20832 / KCTC 3685 / LMG 17431 / NBRC 102448 / NCIMB 2269) TaxID=866895 RepID=I0JJL4_HALH3|nr:acetyltransferase [Halobacillus halophilus]ASF38486.1 acetyltransferase [Halobacillus halophilus]CCG44332.1 probable acetyltransferase EpsM [Halobacillus halophilus DSM 2266]
MEIILIGDGGHSKVIQDIIIAENKHKIVAVLDEKYLGIHKENGIIYGPFTNLNQLNNQDSRVLIAIGNNQIRKKIVREIKLDENQFISVIHPSAIISPSAKIAPGTVVMPNAVINANAVIHSHCIINTGVIVEHDCTIFNYSHLSPRVTLTGNVTVGEGANIGAATTAIPGVTIGEWSVIGAGATVIRDIPGYQKAVGCPAKVMNAEVQVQPLKGGV